MGSAATALAFLGLVSALTDGVPASPDVRPDAYAIAQPDLIALMPTHAIRGIVRAIGAATLTISVSGKKQGELTFVLSPSTNREGELTIGATVSVRYRREGSLLLATAVSTQPEKHRVGGIE